MKASGLLATQTLTFLLTDIEGSTAMLRRLGETYAEVLTTHRRLIRAGLAAHGGEEIDTQGDAFFAVFPSPSQCAAAAIEMQRTLVSHPWPAGGEVRVRMGVHSGEASKTAAGLVGLDVHRAARIAAAGHGGQIVVSATTAALLRDSLPAGASLKDLGLHRLKDLGRPEQLFQLDADGLPAVFPPLRSLDDPKLRNNLPAQVSRFIGREAELAEVRRLVTTSRLVTLTGAGGAGKTRLALQVAAGSVDGSADGVWFADLAPLQDPDLVAVTVAHVLGIREDPDRRLAETMVEAVGGRSLLVLLDNCEHVLDACATLADALLRGCPNIVLLATSREPLGVDGEHVHRVPSMSTPADDDDVAAIGNSEAVRLFTDRAARQGVPLVWDEQTAPVIGRICRRLDGIPLALELAAARLRVMSAAELDARLDQRFTLLTGGPRAALPRQRTLLALADWSWELLNAAERQVLARLSVFAGGFDLGAAEAVAPGQSVPAGEVVGHLGALVDKSLVQFDDTGLGPARYRLLETIRQYAARKLQAQGAAANDARIAHRDHCLALAEAAAPQLIAHDQAEWLDRLDLELDNLRAAVAFSRTQADPTPGLRLAASLRVFWKARGHAIEGADALRALLDAPAAQEATPLVRARALATAAHLLHHIGGYPIAGKYCEEALTIARSAGDDYLVADLLDNRAFILLRQGQRDAALPLIGQGLDLARRLGEPHLTARLLSSRSFARDVDGDHAGAACDAAESLRFFRQAGDRREAGTMLGNLGYAELSLGDLDSARGHLRESLDTARALNSTGVVSQTFNLGLADYLGGSPDAAGDLFAESFDLARRGRMRANTAYALLGLAMASSAGDSLRRSARLHGSAEQALAALGETIEPLEGRLRDLDCRRLRSAMGAEAFEAEYAAGRALTSEQVADLALGNRT